MNQHHFNKTDLDNLLSDIGYYETFKRNYLNKRFRKINYGKRIGEIEFESLFDAAKKYTYSKQHPEDIFHNWSRILNDDTSTEEEVFCTVLEVFVWGDVLSGNVSKAIELYKSKKLKKYINEMAILLNRKEIVANPQNKNSTNRIENEILWSSGWTKVYSFINNNILIYDSRVSAFLNYTLTNEIEYNSNQTTKLNELTKYLFNFQGAENRERLVDKKKFRFNNGHPKGINGLNANLISSWIIELLKEKLDLKEEIRSFERAFFMLGFDLNQIKE